MEMVELYQELEKATAARWKSMLYVHYNFRAQDYCDDFVMIDDAIGHDTCLALCQHVNFKGL